MQVLTYVRRPREPLAKQSIKQPSKSSKRRRYQVTGSSSKLAERCPKRLKMESFALQRAHDFADDIPKFVLEMKYSHVSSCFWLKLPAKFCRDHMPKSDEFFELDVGDGEEYRARYLCKREGLSGGWRGFSIAHNLHEGDVLVFRKIEKFKFKVEIVRKTSSDEVHSLVTVETQVGESSNDANLSGADPEDNMAYVDLTKSDNDVHEDTLACIDLTKSNDEVEDIMAIIDNIDISDLESDVNDQDTALEVMLLTGSADDLPFNKKVSCMEEFHVMFDGVDITPEITNPLLKIYYELCCSQSSYLHQNVVKSLNSKLVAGLISETANIADAVNSSKDIRDESELSTWERTMEASEMMGMNVGFLRTRLSRLKTLAVESREAKESSLEREREREVWRARLKELDEADEEEARSSKHRRLIYKQTAKAPL